MTDLYDDDFNFALSEARDLIRDLRYYPEIVLLVPAICTDDFEEVQWFCNDLEVEIATKHNVIVRSALSNGLEEGWYVFIITRPEVEP